MYWFDAIATRNSSYVLKHQNAAHGNLAKLMKFGYYIFQENRESLTLSILGFRPNIYLLYTYLQLYFDRYLGKYQEKEIKYCLYIN